MQPTLGVPRFQIVATMRSVAGQGQQMGAKLLARMKQSLLVRPSQPPDVARISSRPPSGETKSATKIHSEMARYLMFAWRGRRISDEKGLCADLGFVCVNGGLGG
jgi:hypothetical protein